jgi:hypothetical protein
MFEVKIIHESMGILFYFYLFSFLKIVKTSLTFLLQMQLSLSFTRGKAISHAFFVFLLNTEGTPGKLLNVFIKKPAQILFKDCEQ